MVEPPPRGPRDAPDGAARFAVNEPSPEQGVAPARRRRLSGLAARARAHKVAATAIAVAGFLGLGGIFGQWAVDRIGDLIEGETPPRGFHEVHAAWQDTASLNERLLKAGTEANKTLEEGAHTNWPGECLACVERDVLRRFRQQQRLAFEAELLGRRRGLRDITREASALAGRIRATSTELTGPRADLLRLVTLVGDAAERVATGITDAYQRYGGEPITLGSGEGTPIYSDQLGDDVGEQDKLVTQVAAGLNPTAGRYDRPTPKIRGWLRLVNPEATSDTPRL